jgi:hypothetical protein
VETNTAPAAWWDEPPEVILTAVRVLEERAEVMRKTARRGRH